MPTNITCLSPPLGRLDPLHREPFLGLGSNQWTTCGMQDCPKASLPGLPVRREPTSLSGQEHTSGSGRTYVLPRVHIGRRFVISLPIGFEAETWYYGSTRGTEAARVLHTCQITVGHGGRPRYTITGSDRSNKPITSYTSPSSACIELVDCRNRARARVEPLKHRGLNGMQFFNLNKFITSVRAALARGE